MSVARRRSATGPADLNRVLQKVIVATRMPTQPDQWCVQPGSTEFAGGFQDQRLVVGDRQIG